MLSAAVDNVYDEAGAGKLCTYSVRLGGQQNQTAWRWY